MTIDERIADARERLAAVDDEINAEYWTFTRCAKGNPPRRSLYEKRKPIQRELDDLKRQKREER